jgi:4-amino-4-deoxy-L-arabinose transferase-like glycosyltransferase
MAEAVSVQPRVTPGAITCSVIAIFTLVRMGVLTSGLAPLSMDEAQYWLWSRDLDFGYFSKPPLLAWIIAGTTSICGDGEACIRAASPLLHAGTALLLFGIGRYLFDVQVGAWSAVTYIALPGVSVSGVVASTDAPLLFFWALALYALVRLRHEDHFKWWALMGFAIGLGTLSKYAMLFFVLGLALWVLFTAHGRKVMLSRGALLALSIAGAIVLPNILWNATHAFVSVTHVADTMAVREARFSMNDALDFVAAQAGIFGPILFVLLVCAVARPATTCHTQARFLAYFWAPVLLLMTAQAFLSRAHANWAATAYIAATPTVVAWCLSRQWTGALRVSWALHLIAAAVLYNYEAVAQNLGITLNRKIDPAVRTRSWDQAGVWTSALRAQFPNDTFLFDERHAFTVLSYYTAPHPNALMWNPVGQVNNHFEMTASLAAPSSGSFIYITRRPTADAVAPYFGQTEPLGRWTKTAYPDHDLTLNAFRLTGFRGYNRPK